MSELEVAVSELVEVVSGLEFPEGPIAMPDGSIVLVEMFASRVTRIDADGSKETIAEVAGAPNGAAIGPDGALYICNNGRCFSKNVVDGLTLTGPVVMADYVGGRIQRVDTQTGAVTDLYTSVASSPLLAPNDLVFDDQGGFYFTDHGFIEGRIAHLGGIYYAKADGSSITEVVFPARDPNGIGLSPDGSVLYWAETWTGRLMQSAIAEPGVVVPPSSVIDTSLCLYGFPDFQLLDSLALDSDGNVCVGTLVNGGVTVISPGGALLDFIPADDVLVTNVCFGGDDLQTAYMTLSATGRLVKTQWRRPGAKLNYLNR